MTKNIIEFKNVTKTYEDSGTTVLKDITFEIEEGSSIPYWVLLVQVNQRF